jgi:hypothetical protein
MSIVLPNLTDKEFSSYNDVNRMKRIIDDFFNRVILTKKATNRSVTSGELKHLIEHWAGLKMNHKQERVYGYSNTYILEPFLVKVMHEKGIALIESNLSQSNILFSRCFVGIAKKSIEKLQCFIHQATPDDDFKVKPFSWHAGGPMYKHHRERLHEIGYDDVWKAHDWKKIYYGKHV